MTRLSVPDVRLRASLVDTIADFGEEIMHGAGFWHVEGPLDTSEQGVVGLVQVLRDFGDTDQQLDEKWVHCDFFWITDDPDEVIGFLAVRHTLNAFLLEEGGHIGYSIRPSRRGEGHATRALSLALDQAARLGIDRALVTCDDDNVPSRRTIERNGGVFEDERNGKLRYWIDLSDRAHSGR